MRKKREGDKAPEIDNGKLILKRIAIGFTALFVVIGVFGFLNAFSGFYDYTQLCLAVIFFAAMPLIYWSIMRWKVIVLVTAVLIAFFSIIFAGQRGAWMEEYYTRDTPFGLEGYLDYYPPLEEHLQAVYMGKPNYVAFSSDCIEPALKDKKWAKPCSDLKEISQAYNLNPRNLINSYLVKMQNTAIMLNRRQEMNKAQFQACINNGQCVAIPLLPEDVAVEAESQKYYSIRKAYWDLADEVGLTYEICRNMNLCQALLMTGAMTPADFTVQSSE